MSDTANFDTNEKVNFLFKKDMGFSSTNESIPWFQETNVIVNDYFLSKNLLVSEIPVTPNFNINIPVTDVYLTTSNFTTTSSDYGVKEDSTRNVRKYTKLILDAVPNSSNNSYYKLDNNGNNVLADALQFNTNWDLVSSKPYGYTLTNQSNIAISPNAPDEILQNSTGGNWIFDIKNGIIFFPDYNSSIVDNNTNKPVLTFYKYVGQKGGKFENNSDNSFNNIDISGLIIAKGLNEGSQEKALYYNKTTGEITYDNSGGGGGGQLTQGSDVSLGNIDLTGTLNSNRINLSGNIIPTQNAAYDIGSATRQIKDLYLSSSTLFMGTDTPGQVREVLTISGGRPEFIGSVRAPEDLSTNTLLDELEVSGNVTFNNNESKFIVEGDVSFNKNLTVINNLKVDGFIESTLIGDISLVNYVVTVNSKTSNHPYYGSGSSYGYYLNNLLESPTLLFDVGKTYRFQQDDNTNGSHQIRFYNDAAKTSVYSTNVSLIGIAGNKGSYSEIFITPETTNVLYYQCVNHSFMGGKIIVSNTTLSNLIDTSNAHFNLINSNTSNISTNTSNISTNTSNISTNTSNISTNTSNISTNTTLLSASAGTASASKALIVDSNKDITDIRNLTFTNNILPENNTALLPVSYSSCILKTTDLNEDLSGISTNWIDASGYILTKILVSQHSYVKIEIKATFLSSPAANETISFRVLRSSDGGTNFSPTPVFSDIKLGTTFGVSVKSIYTGLFIDKPNALNLAYKLQFKREGTNIITPYGLQDGGNYMFLQEIYRPIA